jgi:hypothetical protein
MGTERAVSPAPVRRRPDPGRLERSRPRSYAEWKALGRWGKLPAWEASAPGYMLRLAREEAGLTQRALASVLGVTQQAVAQAERWSANPTVAFIERWAEACGRLLVLRLEDADRAQEPKPVPGIKVPPRRSPSCAVGVGSSALRDGRTAS